MINGKSLRLGINLLGFATLVVGSWGDQPVQANRASFPKSGSPIAQMQPPPGPGVTTPSGVTVRFSNDYRYVQANGVPTHSIGQFPNPNNPNAISPQSYTFRLPLRPQFVGKASDTKNHPFGVALNGVVFDPGTAETWQGDRNWRYEALSGKINLGLDHTHAHVQPNGAYHYHGSPDALIAQLGDPNQPMLIGYAADGFPIYNAVNPATFTAFKPSYRIKSGQRSGGPRGSYDGTFVQDYEYVPGLGDLDECNGRQGLTQEFPNGTYYYVVTRAFPFVPRCFMGTPDLSFEVKRPSQSGGQHLPSGPSSQSLPSGQRLLRGQPPFSGQRPSQMPKFGPPPHRRSGPHPPHPHPHHPPR